MEIVYLSHDDSNIDANLKNIISINSNHYWDTEEENDAEDDVNELIYA